MAKLILKINGKETIQFILPENQSLYNELNSIENMTIDDKKKSWATSYSQGLFQQITRNVEQSEKNHPFFMLTPLLEYVLEKNYRSNTVKAYYAYNLNFLKYIGKAPEDINREDIRCYLDYVKNERNLSAESMNIVIKSLKLYYCDLLSKDFLDELKPPERKPKPFAFINDLEFERLFDAAGGQKQKLLLYLVYNTGIRLSELVEVRLNDIKNDFITIGTDTENERQIKLSLRALSYIDHYLRIYKPKIWLFPGQKKENPMTKRAAEKIFEVALAESGLKKDISIHTLRHTFALKSLRSGMDIAELSRIMGHKSVQVTNRYKKYIPHLFKGRKKK